MTNLFDPKKIHAIPAQTRCPEHFVWQLMSEFDLPARVMMTLVLRDRYKSVENDQTRSQRWMQLFKTKCQTMAMLIPTETPQP